MPSTATTNVTIGSILDLIGPTAPSSATGDDLPAFDSLLQTSAAPLAPPPSTATDERSTPAYQGDGPAQRHESSPPQTSTDDQQRDSPSDPPATQHDSTQKATAAADTSTNPKSESSKDETPASDHQVQAAEALVAESLAGLAAVAPAATPAATPAVVTEAKETTEAEPVDPKAAVAKQVAAGVAVNVPAATLAPVNEAQSAATRKTAGQEIKPNAPATIQVATAAAANAKTDPTEQSQVDKLAADAAAKSADKPTDGSEGAKATGGDQQTSGNAHDQHQAPPNPNQPAPTLETSAALPQALDTGTATTAGPPPASPVTAALPTLDAGPSTAPVNNTDAVINAAPPPRSRLPAEFLSQTANTQTRRPSVEVDATRLLNRVARAFTAAQERDGEIRLRLSPPELGSLRLDVRIQDGVLVARLQTETDAARNAIVDNLPALRDRLSEQGVRIERFDVDLMQRQPGGMPDQPGGRQQDLPAAPINVLAPPRRQTETPASSGPTLPTIGSADGLNVVV
jgi:flagellar hook-length control protein FliK